MLCICRHALFDHCNINVFSGGKKSFVTMIITALMISHDRRHRPWQLPRCKSSSPICRPWLTKVIQKTGDGIYHLCPGNHFQLPPRDVPYFAGGASVCSELVKRETLKLSTRSLSRKISCARHVSASCPMQKSVSFQLISYVSWVLKIMDSEVTIFIKLVFTEHLHWTII